MTLVMGVSRVRFDWPELRPAAQSWRLVCGGSITFEVIGPATPEQLTWAHEHRHRLSLRRRPAAVLAQAPPPQPARPRHGSRHLAAPPQLRRIRPLAAEPRHGLASCRAPRDPAEGPQYGAGRRRVRAGLRRTSARS